MAHGSSSIHNASASVAGGVPAGGPIRLLDGSHVAPESNSKRREIGDLAVWTLSSAKQGNGVDQLRDGETKTFW